MTGKIHESMMARAVELALEGAGSTRPNPIVGAVIVKDGAVVGEGFHAKAGGPHAEVRALSAAGAKARGADLYVTLEPCCHEGRTPPCVESIAGAGIARVFIGARDPNPLVNGKGMAALRRAGIGVSHGILRERCRGINRAYEKLMRTGAPLVTAKVALTLDGKIAASSGHSRWITNAACRGYVHELRSLADAVMVGGGTVRSDDPRLTARGGGSDKKDPTAVVVDDELDLPRRSRVFARRPGTLILLTTRRARSSRVAWAESRGHTVIACKTARGGRVDVGSALSELGKRGIASVLLEGGGELFASFVKARAVDRLVACIAPKLVGGEGVDFLPGVRVGKMDEAVSLGDISIRSFDDNVVIEGRPRWR